MKKYMNEELIKIMISFLLFLVSLFFDNQVKILFLVLSYILVSYEMYIEAFKSIREHEFFNEVTLMILATLGAFYIGKYEEAIMVMLLYQLGEYLSDVAVKKSKNSISELMDLRVDTVHLLKNKKSVKVKMKEVKEGDIFQVLPGERVALDGVIIDGVSLVDTSSITGEAIPKKVRVGDMIISGFVNKDSVLTVRSTCTYQTTTTSKILNLIENAEDKKSTTEKFITKFSKVYTPVVVSLALLITIVPTLFGKELEEYLYKGLVFLVTSCPCALVLSVPLGYFCGMGVASHNGAIIKGSYLIDKLCDVDYLLLDKTGTITKGVFEVRKVVAFDRKEEELCRIVASAEEYSIHPIAVAIKEKNKLELKKVENYKELEGLGISCTIDKKEVFIGNKKLLNEHNITYNEIEEVGTVVYVAINHTFTGYIVISDKIKEFHKSMNPLEKVIKKEIVILSGDNKKTTKEVATAIGISSYYGELLPQDKVSKVLEYKEKGNVMFIGDGINDAPVIKISDIGVSMGNFGSDAAIEASDIVLMNDNVNTIGKIIQISRETKKRVKQSIIFALSIKFLIMILSLFGIASIWTAVFADVGVTLISIFYVLTIMWKKY